MALALLSLQDLGEGGDEERLRWPALVLRDLRQGLQGPLSCSLRQRS